MRRILEKRVLPVLAAVCLLVTMVAVAMSFASAADPGTFDGDNYVPKTIGYRIGSFELTSGEVLSYDSDLFFTGDSLKNNQGNWWKDYNGRWTYTGEDATYVSGNVYWLKFNNTTTREEKRVAVGRGEGNFVLTAGEWEVRVELEQTVTSEGTNIGTKVLLVDTFTVVDPSPELIPSSEVSSDTPSDSSSNTPSGSIDFGSENPAVDYSPRTIYMSTKGGVIDDYQTSYTNPSNLVNFTTDTVTINGVEYAAFFVGDSLKNTHWWRDYNFTSGSNTGKITNAYLKCAATGLDMQMQVGYGHTTGGSDSAYVFDNPGEYRLVTGDLGSEKEIARFYVFWPTQDIIDQLVDISQNGGNYYYEKQHVNLVVNDTTGTMCDYVGVDVLDIHVSDSLYIDTVWSNYLFEYRMSGISYQGTVDKIYLYGVEGEVSGYKQYVPGNMGENDHYTEVETGFGEYIDVNDPDKVGTKLFTFELTGTYAIYGEIVTASGMRQSVYMGSFVVSKTPTTATPNPKFTNSEGVYDDINDHIYAYQPREIRYYTHNLSSYLGQYLDFDESCNNTFYVSDKLLNGSGYWSNMSFDYTDVYGQVHTGKIFNLKYVLVTENGTKEMGWGQVGYGHTSVYSDSAFELTEPGLWMLIGQQIEDDTNGRINNVVMATFTVFPLEEDDPRGTGDQFTEVSNTLKWSGTFNKADFRGDRNNINANGYLYANDDELVSLETIAPLRLGTKFNISATYAKNIEVGGTDADQFVLTAGDLMLQVKKGELGTYEANLIYRGEMLGTTYFTEDYKSAVGNYTIENNLGKITVYKDNKALSFTSASTGSSVSSFDISGDYYFNVAYVSIGVAGEGSYIPYLMIKPIDPTVVNVTKTITFEKFTKEDWKGSTGNISADGRLIANGRDLPYLTSVVPYNLGDAFEVSSSLMRTNGYSNYYGEKYVLRVGDLELRVGNDKNGESRFVAEVYYQGVLLGTADRGTAGGYSISALWTLRFENGNISVVAKESKDGTTSTVKFVSEATGSEVTSFQIDEWDFERTYITVHAAGNYGPEGSCYVSTVTIAPRIGAISGVGSTAGTSGSSAQTGDTSTPFYVIFAILIAAGAVLVTVRKVRIA